MNKWLLRLCCTKTGVSLSSLKLTNPRNMNLKGLDPHLKFKKLEVVIQNQSVLDPFKLTIEAANCCSKFN